MGTEIERKFRVVGDGWRDAASAESVAIRQFYLAIREDFSARIRVEDDRRATLTIKTGAGRTRGEFEYPVPMEDLPGLEAAVVGSVIEKRRHRVPLPASGLVAEVDVYVGVLAPLVIAEVELPAEDTAFDLPSWFGADVTDDRRYLNASLALSGTAPAGADPAPAGRPEDPA